MKKIFSLFFLYLIIFSCKNYSSTKKETDEQQLTKLNVYSKTLRLASYNLRLKTPKDTGQKNWNQRKYYVKDIIKEYDFDIIGTQEAHKSQINDFLDLMPQYAFLGKNTNGNLKDKVQFDAIFYKKNKFEVIRKGQFWLSNTPAVPSSSFEDAENRTCVYAHFREKSTGKEFYFFNTHFSPYYRNENARIKSANIIKDTIRKYSDQYPVFLTGDFNTKSSYSSYKALVNDGLLVDTYKLTENKKNAEKSTINAYDVNYKHRLYRFDNIFINSFTNSKKNNFNKPNILILSWENIIKKFNHQNNAYFSSDHNPVMIEVVLNNSSKG